MYLSVHWLHLISPTFTFRSAAAGRQCWAFAHRLGGGRPVQHLRRVLLRGARHSDSRVGRRLRVHHEGDGQIRGVPALVGRVYRRAPGHQYSDCARLLELYHLPAVRGLPGRPAGTGHPPARHRRALYVLYSSFGKSMHFMRNLALQSPVKWNGNVKLEI